MSTDDCTPSTTFIYALLDSRTGHVRYVGKSDDPDYRMRAHCRGDHTNSHKDRWLAQLEREGLWPVVKILEECSRDCWQERECNWIAYFRDAGEPLTNKTIGGDGFDGLSDDAIARKIAGLKAAWADPEVRARRGAVHKKTWADPEYRVRTTEAIRAAVTTPEHRAKLSVVQKAAWDDERRAKASETSCAIQGTDEARAAQSERMRAVLADPEVRARIGKGSKKLWDDPVFRSKQEGLRADPAYRASLSASQRKRWERPEMHEQASAAQVVAWADTERRARQSERTKAYFAVHVVSPEARAKISEAGKRRWADPESRAKQSERMKAVAARRKVADLGGEDAGK